MRHLAALVVVVVAAAITALIGDAAGWTGSSTETAAFLTGALLAAVLASPSTRQGRLRRAPPLSRKAAR